MTRDPIRRRFGKGAARLRVGLPAEAERLSALSRVPIRYERRLTIVPLATAVLIAWLLGTSPLLRPGLAPDPDDAIQVVLETPIAPLEIEPPVIPEREIRRETPRPAPSPRPSPSLADRRPVTPPSGALRPSAREPAPAPFDPNALATRAPSFPTAEILPSADQAGTAAAPLPDPRRVRSGAPDAMPAAIASAARAPVAASDLSAAPGASPALAGPALSRRPGRDGHATGPSSGLVAAAHAGDRDRGERLAALERDALAARNRAAGSASEARRPEVSARATPDPLRALAANAAGSSSGTALDGWQEVPLDELPDCTPAGRQDLLKKRILLAVPFQQECSHQGGSYRFVETRNLGAFLMWSRPNPGQRAGQPRDRDACDVLERALTCLGDRSSQESSSR
jgi:hypothetical protein